jgi:hypothetical protein
MHFANRIAICITFAAATLTATAQQQPKSPVTITPSADSAAPHNWTTEQILTCTVSDCWQLAGRNETTFFDIIQQLAEISAQTRGLTLPDNAEAGRSTGEYIKAKRTQITASSSIPLSMPPSAKWQTSSHQLASPQEGSDANMVHASPPPCDRLQLCHVHVCSNRNAGAAPSRSSARAASMDHDGRR